MIKNIVVAGGGIIGNSIAYYLAKRGVGVTLIDPVGLCPAASGKAGGFLARNWSDNSPVGELQRRSFDLHQEIAQELTPEKIDYRRLKAAAVSVDTSSRGKVPSSRKIEGVEWADLNVLGYQTLGDESVIAQVNPRKLCEAMWDYSNKKAGSKLHVGRLKKAIIKSESIIGVELEDETTLKADVLIIACGPWTNEARKYFETDVCLNAIEIKGIKYHSMLVKSPQVLNQAVFFQGAGDPEFYPRPDFDVYITGFPDEPIIVEETPGQEEVRKPVIDRLIAAKNQVTTQLHNIKPHVTQACYLPATNDGIPLIGNIPSCKGAFIATGHTCWGILNGPATGEIITELILDGSTSHVDIHPFRVERFL